MSLCWALGEIGKERLPKFQSYDEKNSNTYVRFALCIKGGNGLSFLEILMVAPNSLPGNFLDLVA